MSVCLAGAGLAVQIATSAFTLAWTHTIERTAWEEDWRVVGDKLSLVQARVQGSGAGMEPPPEARLVNGFYAWEPEVAPVPEVVLRRAPEAGDWRLCAAGRCAALADWLSSDADPVRLSSAHRAEGCPASPDD